MNHYIDYEKILKEPECYCLVLQSSAMLKASKIGSYTSQLVKDYWIFQLESVYHTICDFLELDEYTSDQKEAASRRSGFYKSTSLKIATLLLAQKLENLPLLKSTNIFGD